VKYNSTGTARWATGTTKSVDQAYSVAVDLLGNVYVSGTYNTTMVIYNSDTSTFGSLVSIGNFDGFIIKYDSSGTVQLTTGVGGTGTEQAYSLSTYRGF
jgi:hypothetical protein